MKTKPNPRPEQKDGSQTSMQKENTDLETFTIEATYCAFATYFHSRTDYV